MFSNYCWPQEKSVVKSTKLGIRQLEVILKSCLTWCRCHFIGQETKSASCFFGYVLLEFILRDKFILAVRSFFFFCFGKHIAIFENVYQVIIFFSPNKNASLISYFLWWIKPTRHKRLSSPYCKNSFSHQDPTSSYFSSCSGLSTGLSSLNIAHTTLSLYSVFPSPFSENYIHSSLSNISVSEKLSWFPILSNSIGNSLQSCNSLFVRWHIIFTTRWWVAWGTRPCTIIFIIMSSELKNSKLVKS